MYTHQIHNIARSAPNRGVIRLPVPMVDKSRG
jgi:hypothetical protein